MPLLYTANIEIVLSENLFSWEIFWERPESSRGQLVPEALTLTIVPSLSSNSLWAHLIGWSWRSLSRTCLRSRRTWRRPLGWSHWSGRSRTPGNEGWKSCRQLPEPYRACSDSLKQFKPRELMAARWSGHSSFLPKFMHRDLSNQGIKTPHKKLNLKM